MATEGHHSLIDALEQVSRQRPLTQLEVIRLERAIRRQRSERGIDKSLRGEPWTRSEDKRLHSLLIAGKRPKLIAILMHRTERAIWRRMSILGWTMRKAEHGSIAMPPEM